MEMPMTPLETGIMGLPMMLIYVTNQLGVPKGAIQFSGGSSAVTVPAYSSLNLTDSFTLSGWLTHTNIIACHLTSATVCKLIYRVYGVNTPYQSSCFCLV